MTVQVIGAILIGIALVIGLSKFLNNFQVLAGRDPAGRYTQKFKGNYYPDYYQRGVLGTLRLSRTSPHTPDGIQ